MEKNYSVSNSDSFYENGWLVAVSVERAAIWFEVSTRRIRQMLIDGKLKGTKLGTSWRINYPYQITMGRRGPLTSKYKNANISPKNRRNINDFKNLKIKKGA